MSWRKPADRALVDAIIQSFRGDAERSYDQLSAISERAWWQTDFWLDAAGLAFYFLDQVTSLQITGAIPSEVLQRLRANLRKNRLRTSAMFREFEALNSALSARGVKFANHKGFTLCPHACPAPEVRHQLDFDFIVACEHLSAAQDAVECCGFRLSARTNHALEFAADNRMNRKSDCYSTSTCRSVELHFCPSQIDKRLEQVGNWIWAAHEYPALIPPEQLVSQALHLLSHLRGESTRPAWVLEFRRHVKFRKDDREFWAKVYEVAGHRRYADMALGVGLVIGARLFGRFAPEDVEQWAISSIHPTIRLWVDRYGTEAVLADFPGTKLFVLLEEQFERLEARPPCVVRGRLFPSRLGRIVFPRTADETHRQMLRRVGLQIKFSLFRARFHVFGTVQYFIHRRAWRRALLLLLTEQAPQVPQRVGSCEREMTNPKQVDDIPRRRAVYAGARSTEK